MTPKLPSVFVTRSSGSSRVTYLDRDKAISVLRSLAQRLVAADERVRSVRLFGSLAEGRAVPGSDADVLVLLSHHPRSRWFDRIPEFLEHFGETDMAVEVFPYTERELDELEAAGAGFARTARTGIRLADRVG